MPVHFGSPVAASWPSNSARVVRGRLPRGAQVEQVHEEVVASARRAASVSTPCADPPVVGAEHAQAADEHGHLGRAQGQQVRAVDQQVLGRQPVPARRGSCGTRRRCGSSGANDSTSVCSCEASVRPGVNGTSTSTPASFAACSTAAQPASTIRSASETCLPPPSGRVERLLDPLERAQHRRELLRVVDLPAALRLEADARAVGAAALVACRGTSRPTPTRWRPAARPSGRRRGSAP